MGLVVCRDEFLAVGMRYGYTGNDFDRIDEDGSGDHAFCEFWATESSGHFE